MEYLGLKTRKWTRFAACCAVALLSFGCSSQDSADHQSSGPKQRPFSSDLSSEILNKRLQEPADARLPLSRQSEEAQRFFPDVINHPWLRMQPYVEDLSNTIVQDIRSLQDAYTQINLLREQRGLRTPSFDEDAAAMIRAIKKMQEPLAMLSFSWPQEYYSVLNIPETPPARYTTPVPFHIFKRMVLDETDQGFPVFMDLRVFNLEAHKDQDLENERALEIINWHLKLLKGGQESFSKHVSEDCIVFIGHGNHDTDHFNPTHGLAAENRGIFAAFLIREDHLYVLFVDAPGDILEKHQQNLIRTLNRPLVEIVQ